MGLNMIYNNYGVKYDRYNHYGITHDRYNLGDRSGEWKT